MTSVQILTAHRPQPHFHSPHSLPHSFSTMLGGHGRRGPQSNSSGHSSPRGAGLPPDYLLLTASPPSSSHHDYYGSLNGPSDDSLFSGIYSGNYDFASFGPPPLPPTSGSANDLFGPEEKNALSSFLDNVESGDTDAYGFPAFWDDGTIDYPPTPLTEHSHNMGAPAPGQGAMTTNPQHLSASYGMSPVAEEIRTPINPFEGARHLRQRSPAVVEAPSLVWGSDPHFLGGSGFGSAPLPQLVTTTDNAIQQRIQSILIPGDKPGSSRPRQRGDSPELDFQALGNLDTPLDTRRPSFSPSSATTATPHTPSASAKNKRRAFDDASSAPKPESTSTDKLEPPPKRKKKAGGRRDNLTEDQKRENHIMSEQKRRDLIRQGFNDLCSLVPELREGGYSKSVVLMHAATFLEELKIRVEKLRGYVSELEGGR